MNVTYMFLMYLKETVFHLINKLMILAIGKFKRTI